MVLSILMRKARKDECRRDVINPPQKNNLRASFRSSPTFDGLNNIGMLRYIDNIHGINN